MSQPPEALPRHELERKLRRSRTLNVALGALAAIGLVFGGVQLAQGTGAGGNTGASGSAGAGDSAPADGAGEGAGQPDATSIERRDPADAMAIGDVDAPVVMSEWIDFRCPFCAVYTRDTLPVLIEEYVDTGKVRIEFHDVAFFGEQSARAAVAARAAGEQGKYAEFVRAVYEAAPESGHPELPTEELIAFAKQVGVADLAQFESDLARTDLQDAVAASTAQAQQLGVTGVPFFAVDGQALSGAQPVDTFRTLLDEAVDAAQ
ncbi:DsbA family protein [Leucobacter chromiireducens]|uniref:DsbA family protein n=1 Tax=Leucobacter chromiireducens TaxID=283877 RepID=UPI000F631FB2|nr:thioredoxin domain-containing protein [Leucobacter chromiireducens]